MGRRDGTVDPRVIVAVSASMTELRRTQGVLNGFWQTSELACGYMLSHSQTLLADPDRHTVEILGNIESAVWFPNNQGRIKRTDTIRATLDQVRANTVHTYRATLFSFFSAFEAYLETEVSHLKPPRLRWGEYVRSMCQPTLTTSTYPLPLRTVLCADFCREIRNKMLHEAFAVPTSLVGPDVQEWKSRLYERACAAGWPQMDVAAEVDYAANQVIGQAINHVQEARKQGKDLPIELFYMLFTFTNLDSLAFALEEALLPPGARPSGKITRKKDAVRRGDLVIGPAN